MRNEHVMTQGPQQLDETAEFPPELNEYNASRYVAPPPPAEWSFEDVMSDGTRLTVARSDDGESIRVSLEWGQSSEPRHQLLVAELGAEEALELHAEVFVPFIEHQQKVEDLAERVAAVRDREDEQRKAEARAHDAASAFEVQTLEPGALVSFHDKPRRLHRRGCKAADRAKNTSASLHTLHEITTRLLPEVHAMLERFLQPRQIGMNKAREDKRDKGYVRDTVVDTLALALCGVCKPLGKRTKDVDYELMLLCRKTEPDPDGMLQAAQLLAEVERACTELDAEYQVSRLDGAPANV